MVEDTELWGVEVMDGVVYATTKKWIYLSWNGVENASIQLWEYLPSHRF